MTGVTQLRAEPAPGSLRGGLTGASFRARRLSVARAASCLAAAVLLVALLPAPSLADAPSDRPSTTPSESVGEPAALDSLEILLEELADLAFDSPEGAGDRSEWTFQGEAGAEVDMLGEEFGSSALFDIRIDVDDPLEESTEDLRFRDETTRTSGVLRLRLDRLGETWLQARGTLKSSLDRTRGDVELSGGARLRAGDLSMTHRLHAQGGEDDPGSGYIYAVGGHWRMPPVVGGVRARASSRFELSRAQGDSLSRLFDYEVWRPSLELTRSLGWTAQVRVRGGLTLRDTSAETSTYQSPYLELGGDFGVRHPLHIEFRSEGRTYEEADSLSPSFHEARLDVSGERELSSAWAAKGELEYRETQYSIDSSVYRDNRHLEATASLATDPSRWGAEPEDELDVLASLLEPRWSVEVGARYARQRYEQTRPDDFDAWSLLLGLGRDGTASTWFDGTIEWGRRTYREEQSAVDFVFEGLTLNLSGTNYTFLSASFLGEAQLYGPAKLSVFGQFDKEFHTDSADDFLLWILTSALTVELW